MTVYRKKPEYVDAFQYDGDLMNSSGEFYVPDWAVKAFKDGIIFYDSLNNNSPACELFVEDIHCGVIHVNINDYIVYEDCNELSVYDPVIFEETFERVYKPNI